MVHILCYKNHKKLKIIQWDRTTVKSVSYIIVCTGSFFLYFMLQEANFD